MKLIYRPHRGGLDESMLLAKELDSLSALIPLLRKTHPPYGRKFDDKQIQMRFYVDKDDRIGWQNIWIVKDPQGPLGFLGEIDDDQGQDDV